MADSEDLKLLESGELDLSRCDFREADLSGMDLRGRDFTHCLFEKAKCEGTRFDESEFRNSRVSFKKAKNAIFDGCDLTKLHFGYTNLSGASLKNVKAKQTVFQHTKLDGANVQGAQLGGGKMDVDTTLEGIISDEQTDFDGLKVLRPTSRHPLFKNYIFQNGKLHRNSDAKKFETVDVQTEKETAQLVTPPAHQESKVAQSQIQHLMRNAIVTRITAQQFATQIQNTLRDLPATHDNKLAEPLQTMLEFADILRNLAPDTEPAERPLDEGKLKDKIAELEALVDQLTQQLANETEARKAAEELAASDGFKANFRRSSGKAAGIGAVSAATTLVTVGVPTAAVYFLGVEHSVVKAFLTVMGRVSK